MKPFELTKEEYRDVVVGLNKEAFNIDVGKNKISFSRETGECIIITYNATFDPNYEFKNSDPTYYQFDVLTEAEQIEPVPYQVYRIPGWKELQQILKMQEKGELS